MLTEFTIPSMTNLTELDISHNKLKSIPQCTPQDLISLKTLNLSHNDIQSVQINLFTKFKQLTHLSLQYNPLHIDYEPDNSTVAPSLPAPASHLIYLNLSHLPELDFLPPPVFNQLLELQLLDLSHSGLHQVSQTTFHRLEHLQEVNLHHNPLNCSCTNAWMTHTNYTRHHLDSLQCLAMDGTRHHISHSLQQCDNLTISNMTSSQHVPLGSRLRLSCHVTSSSPSEIQWRTPRGDLYVYHAYHPLATSHLMQVSSLTSRNHPWYNSSSYHSELDGWPDRIELLADGSLHIDYFLRTDAGNYSCRASNPGYSTTSQVAIYIQAEIGHVRNVAFAVGFLCAAAVFTLNGIYVFSRWLALRLINKRRRETISQLLETINVYKSTQIGKIQENYSHQLSRVRNHYRQQCDRLHANYTNQVVRVRRGCSHQVDKVRENYQSKLSALGDYTSGQVSQIRERANNQMARIRDYGSSQLEGLRETFKLQQQHVIKLLDIVNIDNCRSVIESECLHTESMIFNMDLFPEDCEVDCGSTAGLSDDSDDYNTAASGSPGGGTPECCENPLTSRQIEEFYSHPDLDRHTDTQQHSVYIEMKTPNTLLASSLDTPERRDAGGVDSRARSESSQPEGDLQCVVDKCKQRQLSGYPHKSAHGVDDSKTRCSVQLHQTHSMDGKDEINQRLSTSSEETVTPGETFSETFSTPCAQVRQDFIPIQRTKPRGGAADEDSDEQDENYFIQRL